MSPEDGAFAKHLMTPEVLMTVICALTVIIITRPLTLIILAFIFCMFYIVLELIKKPDTEKSNIHVYIGHMINSRVSNGQKQSIEITGGDSAQVMVPFNSSNISKNNQHSKITQSINTEQQQPKRKPKMSKPSSEIKEKEELPQESRAIQLLSQIYDMTKSVLHDTRKVMKMLDQNERTSKNSTECISTEFAELQKQKESQSLFPDNLSPVEASGSLEGTQDCINQRNSHGSHSTNTLDSKVGEQIKDDVDIPKEVAPLLKNNSLRRITYHFNEIQSPTELSEKPLKDASNTKSDSNISTSTDSYTLLITLALNFFLILHGYGVNLFLNFPIINNYFRISNRQKQSFGNIGGRSVQILAQVDDGKMENQTFTYNESIITEQPKAIDSKENKPAKKK